MSSAGSFLFAVATLDLPWLLCFAAVLCCCHMAPAPPQPQQMKPSQAASGKRRLTTPTAVTVSSQMVKYHCLKMMARPQVLLLLLLPAVMMTWKLCLKHSSGSSRVVMMGRLQMKSWMLQRLQLWKSCVAGGAAGLLLAGVLLLIRHK
jgi:hypothetical protein